MQTLSFQYVDDLIEVIVIMLETPDQVTDLINIGSPHKFTMLELATKVIGLTVSSSKLIYKDLPADDPKQCCPDISRPIIC